MAETQRDPIEQHKRERLLKIYLPVFGPAALLLIVMIVLFILAVTGSLTGQQVTVMAGCLGIVFVLLPLAILMLIPSALMVFLGFASGGLPKLVRPTMDKVRHYTAEGARLTQSAAERVSEPVIGMRTRLEGLQHGLNRVIGLPEESNTGRED